MPELLRLRLLTDDEQAREIAELYWSQDDEGAFVYRVGEIAETFGMSTREVLATASAAGVAESQSRCCSHCGYGRPFKSRSDVSTYIGVRSEFVCSDCQRQAADERREAERSSIADCYSIPDDRQLNCAAFSLETAVGFHALIRLCADESHRRLLPIQTASQPIGPHDYVYDLLRKLNGPVLCVDPESESSAFNWETGTPESFYLALVKWCVPGPSDDLTRIAAWLREAFEGEGWPSHWPDEAPVLQHRIATYELADYLVARFAEHHFQFSPGEKTWEILGAMARSRSIGEGYNLIWRAARDGAAFYVREGCSKKNATAFAIASLRRSFERAETQRWNLKQFSRDWDLPQSEMSHVFYELFLGENDEMGCAPLPLPEGINSDLA